MFRALRKLVLVIGWLMAGAVGVLLYQHRATFYPLVDLVDALSIREGFEQKVSGRISGQVVKVLDGDTFQIKDDEGRRFNIRLTGVDAPDFQRTNKAELRLAGESKTNLSRLILSNRVRIDVTYSNESYGVLGIAHLGETNINAVAVASDIAKLKREYMNGLPLKDRYMLIRAGRKAKELNAGIGGHTPDSSE